MARLTPEELAAFVAESCQRQRLPVKVTDARLVADVAVLLRGDGKGSRLEEAGWRSGGGGAEETTGS